MAKAQTKPKEIKTNSQNSPNQTPKLDNKLSKNPNTKEHKPTKSRQQIYSENYQKNKERKKQQRKERYADQKKQEQLQANQYYQASNIKILLSLKEYTKLNKEKRKLWLDFTATLHQLNQSITTIEEIMRLEQLAGQLIKDYRETATGKVRPGIRNWNTLTEEQQAKLIKYWGREKARIENNLLTTAEGLEQEGEEYEKDIELAKFHEQRGKIKCDCYSCAEQKKIQGAIKAEIAQESEVKAKVQCPECQKWVKKLDEESGVCKNCTKKYE